VKVFLLEQGDIILVRFPFSNQTDYKIRPALVVSNNRHNRQSDAWFCPITTKKALHAIPIRQGLAEGMLDRESYARADVIATMDQDAALKKIGRLRQEKIREVIEAIIKNLE
jgi:mRNA interferase MazF